jgi:flagellar basal body-associated protein FliL
MLARVVLVGHLEVGLIATPSVKGALMRRILALIMVVALIVVMVAMTVAPAFAGANRRASFQGATHSDQTEPGAAGSYHSFVAQQEPMVNGQVASFHAELGPQGQDRNVDGQLSPNGQGCGL